MLNPLENEELNHWFQRLNAPLKRLPADERAGIHQEVRQHLEGLVAAKVAQGQSDEESWNSALMQFGNPSRIGREITREWRGSRTGFHVDIAAIWFGVRLRVFVQVVTYFCAVELSTNIPFWISIGLWLVAASGFLVYIPLGRKYPFQAIKGAFYVVVLGSLWSVIYQIFSLILDVAYDTSFYISPIAYLHYFADLLRQIPLEMIWATTVAYLASVTKRGWYRPSWADFKIALPQRRQRVH